MIAWKKAEGVAHFAQFLAISKQAVPARRGGDSGLVTSARQRFLFAVPAVYGCASSIHSGCFLFPFIALRVEMGAGKVQEAQRLAQMEESELPVLAYAVILVTSFEMFCAWGRCNQVICHCQSFAISWLTCRGGLW